MSGLFATVLSLLAIFLILLVLVQRGRGGGLAGALGGMGGSSAFGAKAGDIFTRITIVTAIIWILICMAAVYWASHKGDALSRNGGPIPPVGSPRGTLPEKGPASPGASGPIGPAQPTTQIPVEEEGGESTAPLPSSAPAVAPPAASPPTDSDSATAPPAEAAPSADNAPANN